MKQTVKTTIAKLFILNININTRFSSLFFAFKSAKLFTYLNINLYRVSQKKVWFAAPGAKLYSFLCNSPVWCFSIFFENLQFFLVLQWPQKKSANLFSLKIKNSEKQKCVNKLFLSKSKILKRLNHRISENLQNCN